MLTPARDAAEEHQRLNKGIKHHLLLLVQIGHDDRLAAVAQPEMGHVNLVLNTAQHDVFLAPIELERIARIARREMQRNERIARTGPGCLPEVSYKALNRRIGPCVAFRDNLLIKRLGCATGAPSKLQIVFEKLPETRLGFRAQLVTNTRLPPPILRLLRVLQILLIVVREMPVSRATARMLRPSPRIHARIFSAVSISNTCSSSVHERTDANVAGASVLDDHDPPRWVTLACRFRCLAVKGRRLPIQMRRRSATSWRFCSSACRAFGGDLIPQIKS